MAGDGKTYDFRLRAPFVVTSEFRNSKSPVKEGSVEEKLYRQSRLCRLLGNPVVYSIVAILHEREAMTPTQIVEAVGRSLGRVSALPGALRLADVVRYETAGGHTNYRLKHGAETSRLLAALANFVEAAGPAD